MGCSAVVRLSDSQATFFHQRAFQSSSLQPVFTLVRLTLNKFSDASIIARAPDKRACAWILRSESVLSQVYQERGEQLCCRSGMYTWKKDGSIEVGTSRFHLHNSPSQYIFRLPESKYLSTVQTTACLSHV